jgi:hypothetical protein
MAQKKPKVTVNCVADKYGSPGERIVEFSSDVGGGLIAFRVTSEGKLLVDVYRQDSTVEVRVGKPTEVAR